MTWHTAYRDKGLVVVGLYHHKSRTAVRPDQVQALAKALGYEFPIAIDLQWRTLRAWWLDQIPNADFTSVTFLVDRAGIIRHIHPGGQYLEGDTEYKKMENAILRYLD